MWRILPTVSGKYIALKSDIIFGGVNFCSFTVLLSDKSEKQGPRADAPFSDLVDRLFGMKKRNYVNH